ncbi:hypothetical protein PIIN_11185, partial [Serendipita indica DSM 11827]
WTLTTACHILCAEHTPRRTVRHVFYAYTGDYFSSQSVKANRGILQGWLFWWMAGVLERLQRQGHAPLAPRPKIHWRFAEYPPVTTGSLHIFHPNSQSTRNDTRCGLAECIWRSDQSPLTILPFGGETMTICVQ